ncbi:MAG: hypothetical protein RLY86_1399 [Pseudomonadota bacterium]|jgi:hypothetical protein
MGPRKRSNAVNLFGMKDFFARLLAGPTPVDTSAALSGFLAAQSAFIAQKCVIEYCRARAGINWDKLFKEQAFVDAMEACRWEAYGAVLADVTVLAEGRLRAPAGAASARLPDRLIDLAGQALRHFGPAGNGRGEDWADVLAPLHDRLVRGQGADPLPAHAVGLVSGAAVYRLLPVHPDIRAHDRELVTNNIRFNLTQTADTMDKRFAPGLAAAVLEAVPA